MQHILCSYPTELQKCARDRIDQFKGTCGPDSKSGESHRESKSNCLAWVLPITTKTKTLTLM